MDWKEYFFDRESSFSYNSVLQDQELLFVQETSVRVEPEELEGKLFRARQDDPKRQE